MRSRAPLGLGGFLALPVFFGALMAASLAVEKPRVVEWSRPHGHLARIFHDPTASNEARIWLLALVPPLLLVLAGWFASYLPFGIYLTCAAAIIDAVALTLRLHRWEVHHTARFPYGEDLLADQTNSSSLLKGEWEHDAAQTVRSFEHYTIGLAVAAALISLFLTYRRRRAPVLGVPSALQQTGGAPTSTGV
ncbi:MAG TPA: hypothetical protein VFA19_00960 [Gaiellaceae bacterium]|nr:hypothetical protein [Gaiellaceae bacterium]